jgi:peptidoglycan-associated lipoprotein
MRQEGDASAAGAAAGTRAAGANGGAAGSSRAGTDPARADTVQQRDRGPAQARVLALDSYSLSDEARAALDGDAKLLRQNASVNLTIEVPATSGHVRVQPGAGERRAGAAREYLVAAGIDAGRLQVISYGKERPFAEGHDESAWSQNRRAHFVGR